ncbi:hypothetical protein F4804DRAFT_347900 [Jackrogersella minutella]|nr:hypothetical protein F4804DRAFT_347900 [Jackrogersella minutella]
MPQDPNLYGQRPAKRQKKEMPLSSSLDFASQLTSLLSTSGSGSAFAPSATASSGRARPSKANKDDLFSIKAKRRAGSGPTSGIDNGGRSLAKDERDAAKISLKSPRGTEDEKQEQARARRRMEEKARLYAAMKRGDYIAKDGEAAPLVDFDRKWAEAHPEDEAGGNSSSGADDSEPEEPAADRKETVEFQDEFGRTRRATRAEVSRLERQRHRVALGTSELEAMAARPTRAPEHLIYGDVVQTAAFDPEADTCAKMEHLASRRDKDPTPPPDTHFDGAAEIRAKGVGFYHFSREEAARKDQMRALEAERLNTERARQEREDARGRRKREIEERRAKIGARRAERLAESFLDGLAGEMAGGGKEKGGEDGGEERGGADDKTPT